MLADDPVSEMRDSVGSGGMDVVARVLVLGRLLRALVIECACVLAKPPRPLSASHTNLKAQFADSWPSCQDVTDEL